MNTSLLRYFLVVAEEKSITRAAEVLHLTQPTLSRQIKQLENEIGTLLFHRCKRKLFLTEKGKLFCKRAEEILALLNRTKREMREDSGEISGEISIGCNETSGMAGLPSFIARFRVKHPRITFSIMNGSNDEIAWKLAHGKIAFGLLTEPVNVSNFEYVRCPEKEEWGILVKKDSVFVHMDHVTSNQLVNVPMITPQDDVVNNELIRWEGKYASEMQLIAHYHQLSSGLSLLRKTDGVIVCSKPGIAYDELVFVSFEPPFMLSSLLAWKEYQKTNEVCSLFIDELREFLDS